MDAPSVIDFQKLELTLDYMVKFLEGGHAKSKIASDKLRSSILHHVRATMSWKAKPRTQEAVDSKISELNTMMLGIVSSL